MGGRGYTVFMEGQNSFALRGRTAALGGKPDLIARKGGNTGTIIDVKTGKSSPSHGVQVMLYMYAVPRAMGKYYGVTFDGRVVHRRGGRPHLGGGRGVHQEPFGTGVAAGCW